VSPFFFFRAPAWRQDDPILRCPSFLDDDGKRRRVDDLFCVCQVLNEILSERLKRGEYKKKPTIISD
jgi:hypothetical protein